MFKFSMFFMVLASIILEPSTPFAQAPSHQISSLSADREKMAPDTLWLSIEENLRNLEDALKADKLVDISGYASSMAASIADLIESDISADVKPHEKERLLNSLESLRDAIDDLVTVSQSNDAAAIKSALAHVSGSVTLTRIDIPPGFLEKISGATVRAEIVNTPVLQKDVPATVVLRLKSAVTGKPLRSQDLNTVYTRKIHALIVEPLWQDYTHAHPEEIDAPGEYSFTFTPHTDCTYRLWADVTPVDGKREYAVVDILGQNGCGTLPVDHTDSYSATVEGYTLTLKVAEGGLRTGDRTTLVFTITDETGNALENLDSVKGVDAHLVAFYGDNRTVMHLPPLTDGPVPLSFDFNPAQAGFVKLFLEVRIDDVLHQFPFGITVQ